MCAYDEDENDDNDEEEVYKEEKKLAKSIPKNGSYIRSQGICRRYGCNKPAAKHQVYCSRDHSPFGNLLGEGKPSRNKQIYKKRPKKKKRKPYQL